MKNCRPLFIIALGICLSWIANGITAESGTSQIETLQSRTSEVFSSFQAPPSLSKEVETAWFSLRRDLGALKSHMSSAVLSKEYIASLNDQIAAMDRVLKQSELAPDEKAKI